MRGLELGMYQKELFEVDHDLKDTLSRIPDIEGKLAPYREYIDQRLGKPFDFSKNFIDLPWKLFSNFTFDELCRIHYSSSIMMHRTVDNIFNRHFQYEIIRKIESSMWRWGIMREDWNTLVHAYNSIRNFNIGLDDFTVRFDYTTGYNEKGYSKYSRTFLDGVFAFLVYYKGKHVMTLGFSIVADKKLLISQIQLTNKKGNRFLYKLPGGRIDFTLDLFSKYFQGFDIYLIDGKLLGKTILENYENALKRESEWVKNRKMDWERSSGDRRKEKAERYMKSLNEFKELQEKVDEFRNQTINHIASTYDELTGKYKKNMNSSFESNGLVFYEIR